MILDGPTVPVRSIGGLPRMDAANYIRKLLLKGR